jgi:hypothetical protein
MADVKTAERIAQDIEQLAPDARRAFRYYIACLLAQKRDPTDERAEVIERIEAIFKAGYLPDLPELPTLH